MLMKNKKGISAVVATVLIVLITVAAVTIIWAAIVPLIDRNLGEETACFDAQNTLGIDTSITYTHHNVTDLLIRVERKSKDIDLIGFDVIANIDGDSSSVSKGDLPDQNGAKVYTLKDIGSGMDADTDFRVSVAPIILIEGTNKTCDAIPEQKINFQTA